MSGSDRPVTKLRPLEFHVFRLFGSHPEKSLEGKSLLVACSGGRDSVALASVLVRLSTRLHFRVALAHVHHGVAQEPEVTKARDRARQMVEELAAALKVPAFVEKAEGLAAPLRSEEELREFRLASLKRIKEREGIDLVAFAHHADDLLETRLIRLIRGTGAQGLPAMKEIGEKTLRPFLNVTREQIDEYSVQAGLRWIDDPSNLSAEPLRNWIRLEWLKALEGKRPGARRSLRASLEQIAQAVAETPVREECFILLPEGGAAIDRERYAQLGKREQRRLIAAYLRRLGARQFQATHVEEVRKRLATPKKVFFFVLLRLRWDVNAEQIRTMTTESSPSSFRRTANSTSGET